MRALRITRIGDLRREAPPLEPALLPDPEPGAGEILIRVAACGVCHTELDEIEGRCPPSRLPRIPGHQVVGRVEALGSGSGRFSAGDRVGVAWIYSACGQCPACLRGAENLCPDFRATGLDADGGYAEWMVVPEAFAHPIPEPLGDAEACPLLCAGAVGLRSLRLAGLADGMALGFYGFGASAHLVLQFARHLFPRLRLHVAARSPDDRAFAKALGAHWTGGIDATPPEPLDAAIDTTPAWRPVLQALAHLRPGGRLVINAIRKEAYDRDALQNLDYAVHLWREKEIKSVANVTRGDVSDCLALAARIPVHPTFEPYPVDEAGRALLDLRLGRGRGAKVLVVP
jgi:propanol-preferring alcohol dehydrogenase